MERKTKEMCKMGSEGKGAQWTHGVGTVIMETEPQEQNSNCSRTIRKGHDQAHRDVSEDQREYSKLGETYTAGENKV